MASRAPILLHQRGGLGQAQGWWPGPGTSPDHKAHHGRSRWESHLQARPSDGRVVGWAWLGRAHGRAGQGRAGLRRAGDQPCCGIIVAGADSPGGAEMGSWAMGRVMGGPGGLAGTVRPGGALGAPSAG